MEILDALFRENSLARILEASDYANADMVSPFVGSLIAQCCGQSDTAPITGILTRYINIQIMLCCRIMCPGSLKDLET